MCLCPEDYEGPDCGRHINPCTGVTCHNGGYCIDNGFCVCTGSWTGPNCTEAIDNCASDPCLNDGLCYRTASGYRCDCTGTGYTGDRCQTNVNECRIAGICSGRGTCIDTPGNYTCNCNEGFTGEYIFFKLFFFR